jgi:hypothetical protein
MVSLSSQTTFFCGTSQTTWCQTNLHGLRWGSTRLAQRIKRCVGDQRGWRGWVPFGTVGFPVQDFCMVSITIQAMDLWSATKTCFIGFNVTLLYMFARLKYIEPHLDGLCLLPTGLVWCCFSSLGIVIQISISSDSSIIEVCCTGAIQEKVHGRDSARSQFYYVGRYEKMNTVLGWKFD